MRSIITKHSCSNLYTQQIYQIVTTSFLTPRIAVFIRKNTFDFTASHYFTSIEKKKKKELQKEKNINIRKSDAAVER